MYFRAAFFADVSVPNVYMDDVLSTFPHRRGRQLQASVAVRGRQLVISHATWSYLQSSAESETFKSVSSSPDILVDSLVPIHRISLIVDCSNTFCGVGIFQLVWMFVSVWERVSGWVQKKGREKTFIDEVRGKHPIQSVAKFHSIDPTVLTRVWRLVLRQSRWAWTWSHKTRLCMANVSTHG